MSAATDADIIIIGAGPVGLLIANLLGAEGHRVLVLERLDTLIDYPRGVGMDDECLRAFQSSGLIEELLPHITPNQWMYFLTKSGRRFLSVEPRTDEYGWPRRNAFIQPLTDAILLKGLERYPNVTVRFSQECENVHNDADGVVVTLKGQTQSLRARYLVGADGGRSVVRKSMGIAFEGTTDPDRWIVVDLKNDPIGKPGIYFYCVAPRPYVSVALPHGIRRIEFMLFDDEAKDDVVTPEELRKIIQVVLTNPDKAEFIRARVYTHNGRLAQSFRQQRVILAGDAAHIMPVWQGQGYNSGIRDAFNLSWKLNLVLKGKAGDALLNSYEMERRDHAQAMIAMSQSAGKIFSPTHPLIIAVRDALTYVLGAIPPIKRYFMEMRYKPKPRFRSGALFFSHGFEPKSPVGTMFIQPMVQTAMGSPLRLDDVIGTGFAVLAWGTNPAHGLSERARRAIEILGIKLYSVVPMTQLAFESKRHEGVTVLGDSQGRLKDWFDAHDPSVVILRPDRIIAAACRPVDLDDQITALAQVLSVNFN